MGKQTTVISNSNCHQVAPRYRDICLDCPLKNCVDIPGGEISIYDQCPIDGHRGAWQIELEYLQTQAEPLDQARQILAEAAPFSITIGGLAKRLGVSVWVVRKWDKLGLIRTIRAGPTGGLIIITGIADVEFRD